MVNVLTILLKWSKIMFFKVKNLTLILLVSYGVGLVNAAQVDPDPGAAGPANPVVLGEGRMPKTLEVLAMRADARRFIRLPQNQNLNFNDIDRYIQGLRILQSAKAQFRDEVIRQYYLLRGQHMPGINDDLAQEIYRFSIQELLDNGRLPAIVNNELDLRNRYIADLDGLTQIPQVNNLQILNLGFNQITQIQPNAFQGLGNLRLLDLIGNQIIQIHSNAFQGLNNLQELHLRFNQIIQIHSNAFQGMDNLRWLDLDNNQITQIHPNAFQGLNNLRNLYLRNNQITQIHPNTFQGLGNLQDLYLNLNQITQILPDTFQGLGNLRGLYLQSNQITQIHPNAFQGLNNLQHLSLRNNQITQIQPDTFQGLGNLRELYLFNNPIIPDQQAQLNERIQGEVGHEIDIRWIML